MNNYIISYIYIICENWREVKHFLKFFKEIEENKIQGDSSNLINKINKQMPSSASASVVYSAYIV